MDALACLVSSKRIYNCPQVHRVTTYKSMQVEVRRSTTSPALHPFYPLHHALMNMLAGDIDMQFQINIRRHVFANELMVKVQRIRECFPGDRLPKPMREVTAAWDDLPNETTDILPMSMKTEMLFLPAPPPTPTRLAFCTDEAASRSSNNGHDADWVFTNNADPATPDVVALQVAVSSTASEEGCTMSQHLHQTFDHQAHERDSVQSTNSPLLSDPESTSSSSNGGSGTPVGFNNMVDQWLLDYRARGVEPFVESLMAFGMMSLACTRFASRIAHMIIRKVTKTSYVEGKSVEQALRFQALAAFKRYWDWNGTCAEGSPALANIVSPTPHGTNIAGFVGSLYDARVLSAGDIHLCLSLLSEGEKVFGRLCAMHALLVQANDKLCKSRNLPTLMQFKDDITSRDAKSGEYLWVTTLNSRAILADILATIERWMVSQALKRDQCRTVSVNRTIRKNAIGPRLRADGYGSGVHGTIY